MILVEHSEAFSRTWKVSLHGDGDSASIQLAIDNAAQDDSISVEPGTYNEAINFLGKGIRLTSSAGASETIIDATGLDSPVVTFVNNEPTSATLEGFTITGGRGFPHAGPARLGGGIFCLNGSPTIRNNMITKNHAQFGAGMFLGKYDRVLPLGAPRIVNNIIESNESSQNGGGLSVANANVTVEQNIIRSNRTAFDGGGIWTQITRGTLDVLNNQVIANSAGDHGGGIHWGCVPVLGCGGGNVTENIIARNTAEGTGHSETASGGGLYITGPVAVRHNTIVYNTAHGEDPCSGGGVAFFHTEDTIMEWNIVAFNEGCGIKCSRQDMSFRIGMNIVWTNGIADVVSDPDCGHDFDDLLITVDPQFCNPEEHDYSLSEDSPALSGGYIYGALTSPGCSEVPVVPVTWGHMKALFAR